MAQSTAVKSLKVPGGEIAYESAGNGRPIVLLHEGIADRRMWTREFEALSKTHRVVRYDLRGYGGSTPATAEFSHVLDLESLISYLHLDHPIIVGPSMGGRIAIDYALANPRVPSALLLMAPGLSGMQLEYDPEGREAYDVDERESTAISNAWKEGRPDEAKELLRKLWASALEGSALELWRTMVDDNAKEVFEDRSSQFDHLDGPPAATRLKELSIPTQVIVGDKDNPSSPRFAMYIARSLPGAQLTIVPGADHVLNMSAPKAFDSALAGLMERVPMPAK
jgi:3-oxoadipate enol-lactonase